MGFTSVRFPLFAAALVTAYYGVPVRLQLWVLLAGSWLFYALAAPGCLGFLLLAAAVCWLGGLGLGKRKAPWLLALSLSAILGLWFACKFGAEYTGGRLPLGISFYCFQIAGYLVDVYRGMEPQKDFFRVALFAGYFPQLVQGPISRYRDLAPSLYAAHRFDREQVTLGAWRLLWGAFKKLVIADRLAAPTAALMDPGSGLLGVFLLSGVYGLRIFADFTGGMDMALGISQMLGIPLEENFRFPLFARNTAQFWQRWHISLGSWMREYVFYPVSVCRPVRQLARLARKRWGNQGKRVAVYAAMVVTWCATALWHGLTPNFLIWGMSNCLVLLVSQELKPLYARFHRRFRLRERRGYGVFEMLRTLTLMNLIRVWDLYPHPAGLLLRCQKLWGPVSLGLSREEGWIAILASLILLGAEVLRCKKGSLRQLLWQRRRLGDWMAFALFAAILVFGCYGIGYERESFIYDRF